jgi:hypothetical protein
VTRAVKLKWRLELLRGWLESLRGNGSALQLSPDQLRMLAEDAIAAHALYAALEELVLCKALKARFEPLQPGPHRVALAQMYMERVGPAWDAAFRVLGISGYEIAQGEQP